MYDILLEHGRAFAPAPRPAHVPKMTDKECFRNATLMVEEDPSLIYVEGMALPNGLPIAMHHAWVVDASGKVIDPTWDTPGTEYFGIPFCPQYHLKAMLTSQYYGIMDNFKWRQFNDDAPELFISKEATWQS